MHFRNTNETPNTKLNRSNFDGTSCGSRDGKLLRGKRGTKHLAALKAGLSKGSPFDSQPSRRVCLRATTDILARVARLHRARGRLPCAATVSPVFGQTFAPAQQLHESIGIHAAPPSSLASRRSRGTHASRA